MADDDPIGAAIVDGSAVDKADVRAYENTRNRVRLTASELRSGDFSAIGMIDVGGIPFDRDASDTTSQDDGAWVYVDGVGNRFLRVVNSFATFDAYGIYGDGDRADYDGEDAGFTFYARDQEGFYARVGATPGTWTALIPFRGPSGAAYVDVLVSAPGALGGSEEFFGVVMARSATFPAGLTGSQAKSGVAATSEAVISLKKNGTEFGTVTFAAGSATGTFAAAAEAVFSAGDELTAVAPSSADATLANLRITLKGAL